jgi:hypothetical protein
MLLYQNFTGGKINSCHIIIYKKNRKLLHKAYLSLLYLDPDEE